MTGRSPICEAALLRGLSATLEPVYSAAAIEASADAAVKFLLSRGVLAKTHQPTHLCRRCQEGCEVKIEADEDGPFFVCPTGYLERAVRLTKDDTAGYRFDFTAFRAAFAIDNGLAAWDRAEGASRSWHPLAQGRMADKRTSAIYILGLSQEEPADALARLKKQLTCERMIVVVPGEREASREVVERLAAEDICLAPVADLLADRNFEIQVEQAADAPAPPGAYCRITSHKGRGFLGNRQYERTLAEVRKYDMFIDGLQRKSWRKDKSGKMIPDSLTPGELHILSALIRSGKAERPAKFNVTSKTFETARGKVDVRMPGRRYAWRAFTTHRTPADPEQKSYQFTPTNGLKYCLLEPLP